MEKLINFKISPNRFEIIKEQQLRRYKNWNLESPHSHAIYYVNYATQSVLWHPDEKIAELEGKTTNLSLVLHFQSLTQSYSLSLFLPGLTVKDLNSFQSDIFSHLFVESLVHGNMESKEAIAMGQIVVSSLSPKPLSPFQRFQTVRAHLLTPNTQTIFEEETRNPENLNSGKVRDRVNLLWW